MSEGRSKEGEGNTNFLTSLPNWLPNLLTLNPKQRGFRDFRFSKLV